MPLDVNYSARYRCVFIHVPKTGGMSICEALDIGSWHHTALQTRRMYGHQFNNYWKFSIVRNPYDRLVSAWEYIRAGGMQNWYDIKLQRELSTLWGNSHQDFDEFCEKALPVVSGKWLHFLPQTYFLCANDASILCDYVGRFEQLDEAWQVITEQVGHTGELPHANATKKRRHYAEYYTSSYTMALVEAVYHSDFDIWQYERGRSSIGRASGWQPEGFVGSSPIDSTT